MCMCVCHHPAADKKETLSAEGGIELIGPICVSVDMQRRQLLRWAAVCLCSISARTHTSSDIVGLQSQRTPGIICLQKDYTLRVATGFKSRTAEPTSGPSLEQDNRHILIISSIGHKEDLPPGRRRRTTTITDLCARCVLHLMLLKILLFLSLGGLFENFHVADESVCNRMWKKQLTGVSE